METLTRSLISKVETKPKLTPCLPRIGEYVLEFEFEAEVKRPNRSTQKIK